MNEKTLVKRVINLYLGEGDHPSHIIGPQLDALSFLTSDELSELIKAKDKSFLIINPRIISTANRLNRVSEILTAIKEAEENGSYETTEHLSI